jgi:hypothetical protein
MGCEVAFLVFPLLFKTRPPDDVNTDLGSCRLEVPAVCEGGTGMASDDVIVVVVVAAGTAIGVDTDGFDGAVRETDLLGAVAVGLCFLRVFTSADSSLSSLRKSHESSSTSSSSSSDSDSTIRVLLYDVT